MSALDDALDYVDDNVTIDSNLNTEDALAELAQLRATVADQARQLEEARHTIAESSSALDGAGLGGCYASQACRTWLSANEPAPQAEQEQTQ